MVQIAFPDSMLYRYVSLIDGGLREQFPTVENVLKWSSTVAEDCHKIQITQ